LSISFHGRTETMPFALAYEMQIFTFLFSNRVHASDTNYCTVSVVIYSELFFKITTSVRSNGTWQYSVTRSNTAIALIYPLRQTTSEISLPRRVPRRVFKHEVSWGTPRLHPNCFLEDF